MDTSEKFGLLMDAYKNNTKLSIIFLLAENERMTVTQMAQHIEVSRSNLYHYISQLVDDGLLNPPEVVPKKNYVEKFYTLNKSMFDLIQWEELEEHFKKMSAEEVRSLLRAFLLGQSFNLQLIAEKVKHVDSTQILQFKDAMLNQEAFMGYSVSHMGKHPRFKEIIKKIEEEYRALDEEGEKESDTIIRSLFLVMPFL